MPNVLEVVTCLAVVGIIYAYLVHRIKSPPHSAPRAWLKTPIAANRGDRKVIVCAGDSITHGSLSHDYVNELAERFPTLEFVNAGLNGNTTADLLARAGEICACRPDVVTILIGTNDAFRAIAPETFETNYRELLKRLKENTSAKLALLSPPVFAGPAASELNKRASACSDIVRRLAVEFGAAYLPLNEKQTQLLAAIPGGAKDFDFAELRGHFFNKVWPERSARAGIEHYLLGQTFDEISRDMGSELTSDGIHMNTAGGQVITSLLTDYFKL